MTAGKTLVDLPFTQADMSEVSDSPEFTAEELVCAKPFGAVFPELAANAKRVRGKQKAPTKQLVVSLRLDREVIGAFKAKGANWQSLMNAALRNAIKET
ncbi:MAG TPA: BrnA antitoxin family protein [Methylocystis sp.]|jgi:uncharacterized protein (DUF4415 family)